MLSTKVPSLPLSFCTHFFIYVRIVVPEFSQDTMIQDSLANGGPSSDGLTARNTRENSESPLD